MVYETGPSIVSKGTTLHGGILTTKPLEKNVEITGPGYQFGTIRTGIVECFQRYMGYGMGVKIGMPLQLQF